MSGGEALRLADSAHLGYRVGWQRQAAAELRRLHAENAALLEALKLARPYISVCTMDGYHAEVMVDAAIKAVEGEKT